MAVIHTSRTASPDEIVQEMDRRGTVIETLESEIATARTIMTAPGLSSIPHDWTLPRIAEARAHDWLTMRDQARDACARAEKAEAEVARLRRVIAAISLQGGNLVAAINRAREEVGSDAVALRPDPAQPGQSSAQPAAERVYPALGSSVAVNSSCRYYPDWQGVVLTVVGLDMAPDGRVSVTTAESDGLSQYGAWRNPTDGWAVSDLDAAPPAAGSAAGKGE